MTNKKRELWADYAKGLGILLVFIGHIETLPKIIQVFIYLFHTPIFFFCMGFYINTAVDWKTLLAADTVYSICLDKAEGLIRRKIISKKSSV